MQINLYPAFVSVFHVSCMIFSEFVSLFSSIARSTTFSNESSICIAYCVAIILFCMPFISCFTSLSLFFPKLFANCCNLAVNCKISSPASSLALRHFSNAVFSSNPKTLIELFWKTSQLDDHFSSSPLVAVWIFQYLFDHCK